MNVFLCQDFSEHKAFLNESESLHVTKVLRKKTGDRIALIDGKGSFYEAEIKEVNKKKCELEVLSKRYVEKHPYYLHLAVAPTKNISRFEWMIEKAIEIGVDEISPILCDHSERNRINGERLSKVALSAVKQSLSPFIPKLNPLTPLKTFLAQDRQEKRLVAHLLDESLHLKNMVDKNGKYCILVGPEGDFSSEELSLFNDYNLTFCILGNKRLRTETAGVVASQIISGIHF